MNEATQLQTPKAASRVWVVLALFPLFTGDKAEKTVQFTQNGPAAWQTRGLKQLICNS